MVSLDWRREKADKGLQYFHRVIASASTVVGGQHLLSEDWVKLVKGRWKDRPGR